MPIARRPGPFHEVCFRLTLSLGVRETLERGGQARAANSGVKPAFGRQAAALQGLRGAARLNAMARACQVSASGTACRAPTEKCARRTSRGVTRCGVCCGSFAVCWGLAPAPRGAARKLARGGANSRGTHRRKGIDGTPLRPTSAAEPAAARRLRFRFHRVSQKDNRDAFIFTLPGQLVGHPYA